MVKLHICLVLLFLVDIWYGHILKCYNCFYLTLFKIQKLRVSDLPFLGPVLIAHIHSLKPVLSAYEIKLYFSIICTYLICINILYYIWQYVNEIFLYFIFQFQFILNTFILLYFSMYSACFSCPNFWSKNKDAHYTW